MDYSGYGCGNPEVLQLDLFFSHLVLCYRTLYFNFNIISLLTNSGYIPTLTVIVYSRSDIQNVSHSKYSIRPLVVTLISLYTRYSQCTARSRLLHLPVSSLQYGSHLNSSYVLCSWNSRVSEFILYIKQALTVF